MYFVISLRCKENNFVILLLESFSSLERSSSSCSVLQIILNITLQCLLFIYSFVSSQSTGNRGPRLHDGKVWLLIYCSLPPCWHAELMGMIPFWILLGTAFKNCTVCLKYPNYREVIDHRFGCVQSLPLVALTGLTAPAGSEWIQSCACSEIFQLISLSSQETISVYKNPRSFPTQTILGFFEEIRWRHGGK